MKTRARYDSDLAAEIRVRGELDRRRAIREGGSQLVAVTHDERRRRGQSRQVFEQVSNDDDLDDLTARAVQKRRCGARAIYKLVYNPGRRRVNRALWVYADMGRFLLILAALASAARDPSSRGRVGARSLTRAWLNIVGDPPRRRREPPTDRSSYTRVGLGEPDVRDRRLFRRIVLHPQPGSLAGVHVFLRLLGVHRF